jgi:hypothetical protein
MTDLTCLMQLVPINQHFPPPKQWKGLTFSWSFYHVYCLGTEKLKYISKSKFTSIAHIFFHYSHQIYILNMYAKFEKCTVYFSLTMFEIWIIPMHKTCKTITFYAGFKMADFRKGSILTIALLFTVSHVNVILILEELYCQYNSSKYWCTCMTCRAYSHVFFYSCVYIWPSTCTVAVTPWLSHIEMNIN